MKRYSKIVKVKSLKARKQKKKNKVRIRIYNSANCDKSLKEGKEEKKFQIQYDGYFS